MRTAGILIKRKRRRTHQPSISPTKSVSWMWKGQFSSCRSTYLSTPQFKPGIGSFSEWLEHANIIWHLLHPTKKEKGLHVIFLDLANCFGSVPHEILWAAFNFFDVRCNNELFRAKWLESLLHTQLKQWLHYTDVTWVKYNMAQRDWACDQRKATPTKHQLMIVEETCDCDRLPSSADSWSRWESRSAKHWKIKGRDLWNTVTNMPSLVVKAALGLQSSPANLQLWLGENPACHLCTVLAFLKHILGSRTRLMQDRYTWCCNQGWGSWPQHQEDASQCHPPKCSA